VFPLLLLVAGCHGGGSGQAAQLQPGPVDLAAEPGLHLSWVSAGDAIEISLTAGEAHDLYQAAATITFPADKYEISNVAPGGGLGNPSETFFAGGETVAGRLEFGYTKRFAGPGEYGDVRLLKFDIAASPEFTISDFKIDYTDSPPLIRDSEKQPIEMPQAGGAQ